MCVSHDEAKRRFNLRPDAAHPVVAYLDYDIVRPGVWDLKYTQVNPEWQDRGLADEIATRVMEFAHDNKCVALHSSIYLSLSLHS